MTIIDSISDTVGNDSCCPDLTYKQRAIGFGICSVLSFVLGIMTCIALGDLITGDSSTFIVMYSLSTATSIASSFFWKGPKAQWKDITDPKRLVCSIVFFIAFVMTWISIYVFNSSILAIIFVAIQMSAGLYYCLTLIPGGTLLAKKCCKKVCCCGGNESETPSVDNLL